MRVIEQKSMTEPKMGFGHLSENACGGNVAGWEFVRSFVKAFALCKTSLQFLSGLFISETNKMYVGNYVMFGDGSSSTVIKM
jgi:hypothetical protein